MSVRQNQIEQFCRRYKKKGAILFGKWMELLDEKNIQQIEESEHEIDANFLIDRILRSIAGFIGILDDYYYQIEPDQRPRAKICIRKVDEIIIGIWHVNKQVLSEEINVGNSFVERLLIFAKIREDAASVLANLFANEVLNGQLQLPGYRNLSQNPDSICLTRQSEIDQIRLEQDS